MEEVTEDGEKNKLENGEVEREIQRMKAVEGRRKMGGWNEKGWEPEKQQGRKRTEGCMRSVKEEGGVERTNNHFPLSSAGLKA